MWETEVVCTACSGTHIVCASIIPRAFSYLCPQTDTRVELPFHDPSRMPRPWIEVGECSPRAIQIEDAQARGNFEM